MGRIYSCGPARRPTGHHAQSIPMHGPWAHQQGPPLRAPWAPALPRKWCTIQWTLCPGGGAPWPNLLGEWGELVLIYSALHLWEAETSHISFSVQKALKDTPDSQTGFLSLAWYSLLVISGLNWLLQKRLLCHDTAFLEPKVATPWSAALPILSLDIKHIFLKGVTQEKSTRRKTLESTS